MPDPIRLLSTDFDGTLIDHAGNPPVPHELFATLLRFREQGIVWAVNTGRALHHIVEGIAEFHFPLQPDYILCSEREVFRPAPGGGWEDFGDWNARCLSVHNALYEKAAPVFDQIRLFLDTETGGTFVDDYSGIGLMAASNEEMEEKILPYVHKQFGHMPEFTYQRHTIFLRFCHIDYSKGAALEELSRLLKIPAAQVFAVGDHLNDIPMMQPKYAAYCSAPGNADSRVKEAVRGVGGYVAKAEFGYGVLEALRHFKAI